MAPKKVIIRMKSPPKRPVKGIERKTWNIDDGHTLDEIARYFVNEGFHPSQVRFTNEYDYYEEYSNSYFYAEGPESDESFGIKIAQYERRMKEYEDWYRENRQLIEEELERRRVLAEEKKRKNEEKYKKQLERARKRAEQELAKIAKRLKEI